MSAPLRLAMLGLHHPHAKGLAARIFEHPGEFALLGGWDPDPDLGAARVREWPGLVLAESAASLLDQPLDGVVVEGRVRDNLRWARLALERGLPVMLEKPAGCDLVEYRAVRRLADERGLHLQMIYLFRYMTAVMELLDLARSGALGEIYEFRARIPKTIDGYARNREEFMPYCGGIWFEMAGHLIDLMVRVLGRPNRATVRLGQHHPDADGFEDSAVGLFEYDHALAILETPTLEAPPDQRRIEVYGTRGAAILPHLGTGHLPNDPTQRLDVWRTSTGRWERRELPRAVLQITDLREFAKVVRDGATPDYTAAHDVIVQELLLQTCGVVPDAG
jgi:predicted dehydrogenase